MLLTCAQCPHAGGAFSPRLFKADPSGRFHPGQEPLLVTCAVPVPGWGSSATKTAGKWWALQCCAEARARHDEHAYIAQKQPGWMLVGVELRHSGTAGPKNCVMHAGPEARGAGSSALTRLYSGSEVLGALRALLAVGCRLLGGATAPSPQRRAPLEAPAGSAPRQSPSRSRPRKWVPCLPAQRR